MKATKIFIVLEATLAISLAVIGVAYGYYVSNQTRVNPNLSYATNTDFWGWFRGSLGFRSDSHNYQYRGNSTIQQPAYVPPPQQYQPQNPNYGYYQYGYRRGCCGW